MSSSGHPAFLSCIAVVWRIMWGVTILFRILWPSFLRYSQMVFLFMLKIGSLSFRFFSVRPVRASRVFSLMALTNFLFPLPMPFICRVV